jgi:hypothetical protein
MTETRSILSTHERQIVRGFAAGSAIPAAVLFALADVKVSTGEHALLTFGSFVLGLACAYARWRPTYHTLCEAFILAAIAWAVLLPVAGYEVLDTLFEHVERDELQGQAIEVAGFVIVLGATLAGAFGVPRGSEPPRSLRWPLSSSATLILAILVALGVGLDVMARPSQRSVAYPAWPSTHGANC